VARDNKLGAVSDCVPQSPGRNRGRRCQLRPGHISQTISIITATSEIEWEKRGNEDDRNLFYSAFLLRPATTAPALQRQHKQVSRSLGHFSHFSERRGTCRELRLQTLHCANGGLELNRYTGDVEQHSNGRVLEI
jgi:hypothetical protein